MTDLEVVEKQLNRLAFNDDDYVIITKGQITLIAEQLLDALTEHCYLVRENATCPDDGGNHISCDNGGAGKTLAGTRTEGGRLEEVLFTHAAITEDIWDNDGEPPHEEVRACWCGPIDTRDQRQWAKHVAQALRRGGLAVD
jgi:hypothetical protein